MDLGEGGSRVALAAPDERREASRGLEVETTPFWGLPPEAVGRAENVAFSRDGSLLAVVDAGTPRVVVHERREDGRWADRPSSTLEAGGRSGLDYPHDVDLSPDGRWLVVANRTGRSVAGYRRLPGAAPRFAREPSWQLRGRRSRLGYCDGVRFVPGAGRLLAAVSLAEHRVTFLRRAWPGRGRFSRRPLAVLEGEACGLHHPDGLAFSPDGSTLAVANHGSGDVVLFAASRDGRGPPYGPRPFARLSADAPLRCPHSVAFSRDGAHLAVTEAGGPCVRLFRRERGGEDPAWSPLPVRSLHAVPPGGTVTAEEGGPKGVAFGPDALAVSSPEIGVRLHRLR